MNFVLDFWPAILAAAIVGAAAPAAGSFIVQKRLSLIGDGVGHIAFAGVALGLWLDISPLLAAVVASIAGALAIDRLRKRQPEEADMALALFFYGSIALAVVVASKTGSFNVQLFGFLFGQLLTVTVGELVTMSILSSAILLTVVLLYQQLLAIAIDEEAAAIAGVRVPAINALLMVLAAAAIAVGMQVVGILLIAALMVLPVGIARNLAHSFRMVLITSCIVGAGSAFAGIFISSYSNTAPSGTIVLVLSALFVFAGLFRRMAKA